MIRILVLESDFSSAHLYKNEKFSSRENEKAFGRCYTEYGHGHNYKLEVGFLIAEKLTDDNLAKTKSNFQNSLEKLTKVLDHEHLNFVIPEFKKTVPTTENILLYFEKKFSDLKMTKKIAYIKLFESETLWSEKYYVTI